MATIPLCFEFFRCRIDVLQSWLSRSTISIAVFCLQNLIWILHYFAIIVFNMKTSSFSVIQKKQTRPRFFAVANLPPWETTWHCFYPISQKLALGPEARKRESSHLGELREVTRKQALARACTRAIAAQHNNDLECWIQCFYMEFLSLVILFAVFNVSVLGF